MDRPGSVRVFGDEAIDGVAGTARFDWDALDAWYEEDEQVFVHPRNPYVRVDALRSHRHVRASLAGITLAESVTPVLVFETGLPTRYYFDRTDVDFGQLVPTGTQTACPYKGVTSAYWSVRTGGQVREGDQDLAWSYDFPTPPGAAHRGPGRLLQREGRHRRGRRATAPRPNPLLPVITSIAG